MIENIIYENDILAIIVTNDITTNGINFITPDNLSQQVAFMKYEKNKIIQPHIHNTIERVIYDTNEVLYIINGKLRVDFYNKHKMYIKSRILKKNDLIILISGGHGFATLDDIEMIEIKQGPYVGLLDKQKFESEQLDKFNFE